MTTETKKIKFANLDLLMPHITSDEANWIVQHMTGAQGVEPEDDKIKFPCTQSLGLEQVIRAKFIIGVKDDKPIDIWVDMPYEAFEKLPVMVVK